MSNKEKETVTTWWNIDDTDHHLGNQPTGTDYIWCTMISECDYEEEKFRLHEPIYDRRVGRVCSFWLKLDMPKYLWHLYEAGLPQEHDKWDSKVYDFSMEIINDWVETQRIIHWGSNKDFYYKDSILKTLDECIDDDEELTPLKYIEEQPEEVR